jgi:gamma-glutamyl hydrolase
MIGVLTQPLTDDMLLDPLFTGYTTYIQASYIRWLESAGARAVPLIYGSDLNATLNQLTHLNGVLYCGGDAEGDYITWGKQIFDKVKSFND